MIYAAIYPRKSKKNDNSDSMELQVDFCTKYAYDKFGKENVNITVYGADYGVTGHSMKKRYDFKRMMDDIRLKKINLVLIIRYDRIARNTRDFCNLYHDMEINGCNLISISQQIDTSTPYGKKFMYDMASMAELEWAITSERYKDTVKYKISHGYAYCANYPFGFKIVNTTEGKKVVHDREEDLRKLIEVYAKTKSKADVVRYARKTIDPNFTLKNFYTILNSDLLFGKCRDNDNFCEPYYTKEYVEQLRNLKVLKQTPTGNIYIFSQIMRCPICGRSMSSRCNKIKGKTYYSYRCCGNFVHKYYCISEITIENQLLEKLDEFYKDAVHEYKTSTSDITKEKMAELKSLNNKKSRLNYMFENGRIEIDDYDKKYRELEIKISELNEEVKDKNIEDVEKVLIVGWKDAFLQLDRKNKREFIHRIIDEIILDENKKVKNIIFKEIMY